MTERTDLLASIAATTADYREGDLPAPTSDHVDRWVRQFDEDVQKPILREIDHVLKQTYFSKEWVSGFFANQIKHDKLTGSNPASFWKSAHFLDIQQNGNSQSEIGQLFGKALLDQLGLKIESCGNAGGAYIYLDDVIFTGGRVKNDLTAWIRDEAPAKAVVHILVINGIRIRTSEAIYQACRFPHMPDVQRLIINERSPMTAKMRSKPYRKVSRSDWNAVRVKIMRWSLRVKLAQNWSDFGRLLLATGDRPIVDSSRRFLNYNGPDFGKPRENHSALAN